MNNGDTTLVKIQKEPPKVILPFQDKPFSMMLHHIAFPMGIIQANAKQDITPWLCGRLIHCACRTSEQDNGEQNIFKICLDDSWSRSENILKGQMIELFAPSFSYLSENYTDLLRRALQAGLYPQGIYNEQYIPEKWAYGQYYYEHDFLIIGYDDEQSLFYSVGYLKNHQFQRFTIPYEAMEQSLKSLTCYKTYFCFWEYNTGAQFVLNPNQILRELKRYITSFDVGLGRGYCYGMDAIHALARSWRQEMYPDFRYTRGLMEHKFFMKIRMEYFFKQGYLQNESYVFHAEKAYQKAERIHMMYLKYAMTKQPTILQHMQELAEDMLQTEKEYLPSAYEYLSQAFKEDKP